jgi:alpha-beta hydrolase superfamily lysophospholipase
VAGLLDHPLISERYFFPRRAPLPGAEFVSVGDGVQIAGLRTSAGEGSPWLLHFHGNAEITSDWGDLARALEQAGVSTFFSEYRGYGASTGEPRLAAMLDDALRVADHLQASVPWERMFVYGRSVGSLFALHVAAHRPVAGLVLESGIADLLERLEMRLDPGEIGADAPALRAAVDASFDHHAKLAVTRCPVLVLHTTRDHLVDVSHGHRLAEWAGPRGRLVEFPKGDHNSIFAFNASAILAEVVALCHTVTARADAPTR